MSEPSETETVGYGKPPLHSQYKRGTSGNLLGRPKRKLDMSVALNSALNDKIVVSKLGAKKTGLEASVQSTVDRVLQGDPKGIRALMQMFEKAKIFKPVADPTRLIGVVVEPPAYKRDKELGIEQGFYSVGEGKTIWVDPITKNVHDGSYH